jgi:hypothetical protein
MAQEKVQHRHTLEVEIIDPHSQDGGRLSPETLLMALNAAQKAAVESLQGVAEVGDLRVSTWRETDMGVIVHESEIQP